MSLRFGLTARHEGAVGLAVQFVIVQQRAAVFAVIRPVASSPSLRCAPARIVADS